MQNSQSKQKKILTVKLSSLGDILLFTPILAELQKREPNALLYHLIAKSCAIMLKGNPHLTQIIETDDLGISKSKFHNFFILLKLFFILRKYHFDEVYIFHRNTILLYFFTFLRIKKINMWSLEKYSSHTLALVEFNLQEHRLYRHLKMIDENSSIQTAKIECFLDAYSSYKIEEKRYLVIFPGGGNNPWAVMKSRQWSKENYIALIQKIQKTIVLVGGKTDIAICADIEAQCKNNQIINLAGKISIADTAKIIKESSGFVGNDSMPLFLACSYDIPVCGIFCSTAGKLIMPPNKIFFQIPCPIGPCYNPLEGTGNGLAYTCKDLVCTTNQFPKILEEIVSW